MPPKNEIKLICMNFDEHSDLDLCIVTNDLNDKQKREIENYFYNILKNEIDPDFTYCTNKKLRSGKQVFAHIRNEGRILYKNVS
ncbi:MAG: hypothetical protein FWB80_15355 [Defluviitaleaceae bacterium]|nr:hypothetical protein [Defluviitaleaceae bacterium]MCL2200287.1 hypothetical protein [Defluviitaleaceae bacterium]